MLKTLQNKKLWFVSQPDHGEVAGFLAAHWGNEEFACPGYFASSGNPERLRAETVFAVAQHDNGWWEWEAAPRLAEIDGFPLGLTEVIENQQEALDRWRLGIPRFSRDHPYVSLLIGFHAYWLCSHGFLAAPEVEFRHPLLWKGPSAHLMGEQLEAIQCFVAEVEKIQKELIERLREDPECRSWVDTEHLNPHVRLLQVLDGLSLSLCAALIPPRNGRAVGLGRDSFDLLEVPRKSWQDRVRIVLKPVGEGRIACSPYPFNVDPLTVFVPARTIDWPTERPGNFQSWWHSEPKQTIRFEYSSI